MRRCGTRRNTYIYPLPHCEKVEKVIEENYSSGMKAMKGANLLASFGTRMVEGKPRGVREKNTKAKRRGR